MDRVNFEDAVIENGYIYFFDNLIQAMCRADLKSYDIEILAELNSPKNIRINKIYSYKNTFFLLEYRGVRVFLFDRKQHSYKHYEYNLTDSLRSQRHFFFLWEDQICFLPFDNKENIVRFDVKLRKFSQTDSINKLLGKNIESFYGVGASSIYRDTVFLAIQGTDQYIEYNLSTKRAILANLKKTKIKLFSLLRTDELMTWILEDRSLNLVCGEEEKSIIKIQSEWLYSRICNLQNYVCLLPRDGNHVILINKFNLEIKDIVLPLSETEINESRRSNFVRCVETESGIFIIPQGIKTLFYIAKGTFKVSRVHFRCNNYMNMVISRNILLTKMITEHPDVNLNLFIDYISSHADSESGQNHIENVGGNIWDAVKD